MSAQEVVWHGRRIRSWAQFHRHVKQPGRPLLARLGQFRDAVLVAGCQRSGTTAVARALGRADGVADHRFGPDDELDAALLLAGHVERALRGRCCLQTTYLNDRYPEYFEHENFKLVWVLRDPFSVVYSMLHNWKRGALRRLYDACGRDYLGRRASMLDGLLVSRFEQACASYAAKLSQTFELAPRLPASRIIVIDYDDLVLNKHVVLPKIFEFAGLPIRDDLIEGLHAKSVRRGSRLPERMTARVEEICVPIYERALTYRTEIAR